MEYFNNVLTTFLGLKHVSCVALYGELSDFTKNILIYVLKKKEGLTGLEWHFHFWMNLKHFCFIHTNFSNFNSVSSLLSVHQYGIKKREVAEAEAEAAMEQATEGSLTRPKKAVPSGCGDDEEEESIMDTVMKYLPGPLQDMLKK